MDEAGVAEAGGAASPPDLVTLLFLRLLFHFQASKSHGKELATLKELSVKSRTAAHHPSNDALHESPGLRNARECVQPTRRNLGRGKGKANHMMSIFVT